MDIDMAHLPNSWQKRRIRDIGDIVTGRTPSTKREDFYGGDYNLISPADLDAGKYVLTAHKRLTPLGLGECRALPRDTVLVGCIGNIGKLGMVSNERSATNQQINAVICNHDNDAHFIYYCLYANRTRLEHAADKTTVPILNKTNFENFQIAVPLLPEQRKIAAVLGLVQQAIEQQERLIALTTELKKTLLHQLFTQGLHGEPQKQTEIGPVPESWEVVKIGSLGKVVTGTTPKTKVPEYYSPPEVDFIAPVDLGQTRQIYSSEKKISRRGLEVIRNLPKNSVMCVCIGSSIGKVGMTSKADSATNQQINSIVCNEKHDPAFAYYLLSYFAEYWRGFATFGPVPILSKGGFEAINIVLPATKDEELEIAQCFTALDAKMEVHMHRKALLTDLFRTLLHQLMTAQIRVHEIALSEV